MIGVISAAHHHSARRRYEIAAGVHTLSGYSAHADREDLLRFVRRMRRKPREIRLVHGDEEAKRALAAALRPHCPEARIVTPGHRQSDGESSRRG